MGLLRNITLTSATRIAQAVMSLAILVTATRHFGAEGYGTITLIVVAISMIQIVSNLVGGPAIVYLAPRENVFHLFVLSNAWALLISVLGANLLWLTGLIPDDYRRDTLMLSLLNSLVYTNFTILLARERLKAYNALSALQIGIVLGALLYFVLHTETPRPYHYLYSLYASYVIVYAVSLFLIRTELKYADLSDIGRPLRACLRVGGTMQGASILQFFNYRISYYLIKADGGTAILGQYSPAVQLAEGLWIIAKSAALVLYARIANQKADADSAVDLTLKFIKATFIVTLLLLIVLLLIPGRVFTSAFGNDFTQVKIIIACLSPGIMAVVVSQMLSHFFSGIGKPAPNAVSSGLGLFVILIAGLILIPRFGIVGAALATSLSYMSIVSYQIYVFTRLTRVKASDFLVSATEVRETIRYTRFILSSLVGK